MKIYLTAIVKAKPQFKTEVENILSNMILKTQDEEACELYTLHQSVEDENMFVFYEIWKNQKGLDFQNEQNYIKEFVSLVDEKLQEKPLVIKMKLI
jgi:quinol monooxygenase YgiN